MRLVCDNCAKTFSNEGELEHLLPDIPGLGDRLDPGGVVPNGTCPECGSLVYAETELREDRACTEGIGRCNESREKEYLVEWSIDIPAASFRHAAERALRIQRKRDSIATVFDVTCSDTGVRRTIDLSERRTGSEALRCRVCGDQVAVTALRAHLCLHNPNADNMEWEEVRDLFSLGDLDDGPAVSPPDRVVIAVRGGVAGVTGCPDGVVVEIRDYDTDGCDADRLADDGSIVDVVTGPIPDWIDGFAAGAAEELRADGLTESEARAIASEAAGIIREHEAKGKPESR